MSDVFNIWATGVPWEKLFSCLCCNLNGKCMGWAGVQEGCSLFLFPLVRIGQTIKWENCSSICSNVSMNDWMSSCYMVSWLWTGVNFFKECLCYGPFLKDFMLCGLLPCFLVFGCVDLYSLFDCYPSSWISHNRCVVSFPVLFWASFPVSLVSEFCSRLSIQWLHPSGDAFEEQLRHSSATRMFHLKAPSNEADKQRLQWVDPSQPNLSQYSLCFSNELFFKEIVFSIGPTQTFSGWRNLGECPEQIPLACPRAVYDSKILYICTLLV